MGESSAGEGELAMLFKKELLSTDRHACIFLSRSLYCSVAICFVFVECHGLVGNNASCCLVLLNLKALSNV